MLGQLHQTNMDRRPVHMVLLVQQMRVLSPYLLQYLHDVLEAVTVLTGDRLVGDVVALGVAKEGVQVVLLDEHFGHFVVAVVGGEVVGEGAVDALQFEVDSAVVVYSEAV